MGDRANVKIKESTGNSIWVYTHWHGHEFPEMLQDALKAARERWLDDSYCQRVLITELCKPATDATGFGVSTYPTDNEHDILEVDMPRQKVRRLSKDGFHEQETWNPKTLQEWKFSEYVSADLSGYFET